MATSSIQGRVPSPVVQGALRELFGADADRNARGALANVSRKIIRCVELGLSLKDIEQTLRQGRCYTYLIARKRNSDYTDAIVFRIHDRIASYYLFLTTKDEAAALTDLHQESATYEENFEKLDDTGFLTLSEEKPVLDQFAGGTLEWSG